MSAFACSCFNVSITVHSATEAGSSASGRAAPPGASLDDVLISRAELTMLRESSEGATLRCAVCSTDVFQRPSSPEDGDRSIKVLVGSRADVPGPSRLSPIFHLALPDPAPSTSATLQPFFSPPSASLPSASSTSSQLLPALPEPFFLPHPFSPSHPLFSTLAIATSAHLLRERDRFLKEIDAFVEQKRAELEAKMAEARVEVRAVWTGLEHCKGMLEEADSGSTAPERKSSRERLASGSQSPAVVSPQPFPADKVTPTSERSTRTGATRPKILVDSEAGSSTRALASSPSLLSASIAQNSYISNASPSTSSQPKEPLFPHSTTLSSGSATPLHRAPRSRQSSGARAAPTGATDLDLATSLIASTWKEPANLIFSQRSVPKKPSEMAASAEPYANSSLAPAEPVVTPEEPDLGADQAAGGEQEVAFIERRGERVEHKAVESAEEDPGELKKGQAEVKSPRRKVQFSEPGPDEEGDEDAAPEDQDGDSDHEDVFDFEPQDPDPVPGDEPGPTLPARPSSDAAPLQDTSTVSLDPALGAQGGTADPQGGRTVSAMSGEDDGQNKLLTSMRTLTAADLPSHRAAWKDRNKTWQIYGRLGRVGGADVSKDEHSPDPTRDYKYGQSLPIDIFPKSPASTSPDSKASSGRHEPEPLERKTSLSDRKLFVPPLRKAMRPTLPPTASSSSVISQAQASSSGVRDPGPLLDDDGETGDDGNESGFVAPHLRTRGADDGVGWASMVDRPAR